MATIDEQIEEIKKEIAKTQRNKATEHHIGTLYARIAILKRKKEKSLSSKGGGGYSYSIRKRGDATVALVGFPSVGKSTLINKLTNANSEVAPYEFTTLKAIPGMMEYKDAKIQIIDLPGIISEASEGRGRGKEVLSVVRNADLILIVLDAKKVELLDTIKRELYNAGIRLDRKPPKIFFRKAMKGGINIMSTHQLTHLTPEMIKVILRRYGFLNGDVVIKEDIGVDDFIDALLGNRHYVNSLIVINKVDQLSKKELKALKKRFPDAVFISAKDGKGIDELKEKIFNETKIIRVYLKPKGEEPDMSKPIILHKGDRIYDLCLKIHKSFVQNFRYAQVWGPSAKFPAQKLGLNHELKDGDIVTIVT